METKRKAMKFLVLGITIVFFVYVAVKWPEKKVVKKDFHCITTVDFDISDPDQLEKYLMGNIWTVTVQYNTKSEYTRGKNLKIKVNDDLILSTWASVFEDERKTDALNNIGINGAFSTSGKIEISYYDQERTQPYLNTGASFTEIAEDYYTIEYCDSFECTVWKNIKNEIEQVDFNGTYNYNDRTFIIDGEDLYHVEVDKHYIIHQTDYNRLSISGQVISEMPSYRFWIDENENIILLSDGLNLFGIDEDLIKSEYPFYILVKQK